VTMRFARDSRAACQPSVTPLWHNGTVNTQCAPASQVVREATAPGLLSWCRLLQGAGSETILPAGGRITDEQRPGRYCFLLLDGSAVAEAGGRPLATFSAGSFIGSLGDRGLPVPLRGITVRVIEPSHALVLDARKLAALLDSDRALAAAWLRHKPAHQPRRYGQARVPAMSRAAM
jgi:CRP-like cAMP-binding protein